jgi:hypothetical protein
MRACNPTWGALEGLAEKLEVVSMKRVPKSGFWWQCADDSFYKSCRGLNPCTPQARCYCYNSAFTFLVFSFEYLATTFIVADMCIISDDISFKRFSTTNFNNYLRRLMLSLISINSDDIKGCRYLVFSDGLIATTGSDDHSRR